MVCPSKNQLFSDPCSTVLLDRDGELMGASIADDGQWRFPQSRIVPYKFMIAITQFEDQNFFLHSGVDYVSVVRAAYQNIASMSIVSGGSTITMQVVRIARKNQPRNFFQKFIEIIWSFRLELTANKLEILSLYASNAPFGGNVVGLDAAAWRYYGRSPDKLSWGEAATLAVLPNSPSLVHPGKNDKKLLEKRNRLLDKLFRKGFIDESTCELAKQEPLPGAPKPLPRLAPHLLDRLYADGHRGEIVTSSVDKHIQERLNELAAYHHGRLKANDISNLAALILDTETGEALGYVGNIPDFEDDVHGCQVDIITASRSTGSILKPFLYAALLQDGKILPTTLIPDIPSQIYGFKPENYNKTYDGAVPAKRALARSLNIPAVFMLRMYGADKFHFLLRKLGMSTIVYPASHYGLAMIIGGAEGTLWDMTGIFASMARTLKHYPEYNGMYDRSDFHSPTYIVTSGKRKPELTATPSIFSAAAIWTTFNAMIEVSRPDEERNWKYFSSSSPVAWKTGTSFGNRDGWAIGCTPQYTVGVWVGNADGEGRPFLTGISAAAPLLFDIFSVVKPRGWFSIPYDEMERIPICRYSGYKNGPNCESIDTIWALSQCANSGLCPYHQIVHLDSTEKYRVNSECELVANMKHKPWFVLPPVMEYYFRSKNSFYKMLPPLREDCSRGGGDMSSLEIIYPKPGAKIYVPVELDGTPGQSIFKAAHRAPEKEIFWHLDDEFVTVTTSLHSISIRPPPGKHRLTLVDEDGETIYVDFEVLEKGKKQN